MQFSIECIDGHRWLTTTVPKKGSKHGPQYIYINAKLVVSASDRNNNSRRRTNTTSISNMCWWFERDNGTSLVVLLFASSKQKNSRNNSKRMRLLEHRHRCLCRRRRRRWGILANAKYVCENVDSNQATFQSFNMFFSLRYVDSNTKCTCTATRNTQIIVSFLVLCIGTILQSHSVNSINYIFNEQKRKIPTECKHLMRNCVVPHVHFIVHWALLSKTKHALRWSLTLNRGGATWCPRSLYVLRISDSWRVWYLVTSIWLCALRICILGTKHTTC